MEDIIPIAMALLRKHGENEPFDFILSEQAANKLKEHSWPGNVRELENVIQRALVLNDGPVIEENSIFLQDLRGADVGRRLLAADVLLAGLEREPQGRAALESTETPTTRPGSERWYDSRVAK